MRLTSTACVIVMLLGCGSQDLPPDTMKQSTDPLKRVRTPSMKLYDGPTLALNFELPTDASQMAQHVWAYGSASISILAVPIDVETASRRSGVIKALAGKAECPPEHVVCRPWIGNVETGEFGRTGKRLYRTYKLFGKDAYMIVNVVYPKDDPTSVGRADRAVASILKSIRIEK
jgi:hypothetical protein